jgi:hypothetical protein
MTSDTMDNITGINLPPPSPATRQVGVSLVGSPLALTRSTSSVSNQSDIRTPEESLRDSLSVYKSFLLHEIAFIDNEITALIERDPDTDARQQIAFLQLRNGLKIRFNTLQTRLARVNALLDVM